MNKDKHRYRCPWCGRKFRGREGAKRHGFIFTVSSIGVMPRSIVIPPPPPCGYEIKIMDLPTKSVIKNID